MPPLVLASGSETALGPLLRWMRHKVTTRQCVWPFTRDSYSYILSVVATTIDDDNNNSLY